MKSFSNLATNPNYPRLTNEIFKRYNFSKHVECVTKVASCFSGFISQCTLFQECAPSEHDAAHVGETGKGDQPLSEETETYLLFIEYVSWSHSSPRKSLNSHTFDLRLAGNTVFVCLFLF